MDGMNDIGGVGRRSFLKRAAALALGASFVDSTFAADAEGQTSANSTG